MANPNGNPQNFRAFTSDEARINGRKGGLASAESRRRKKSLQELAQILLSLPVDDGEIADIEAEGTYFNGLEGQNLTLGAACLVALARKAVAGDIAALKLLQETAGEQPVQRVEMNIDRQETEEMIDTLVAQMKAKHKAVI